MERPLQQPINSLALAFYRFVFSIILGRLNESDWQVLYHVMEVVSGFKYTKHNDPITFLFLYFIPNGVWIWVPLLSMWRLGSNLANLTSNSTSPKKSKKSN